MSVTIHGSCDERFLPLRDAFAKNFDAGLERGASLALTYRGQSVVDLWAGHADLDRTKAWAKDTIAVVFSTTKMAAAICALMAVDRGLIELDERVARYWPQFAQGNKDKVTVRQALSHQAGIPGFAATVPWPLTLDYDAILARIAAEPHWFGGAPRICYHVYTYGFILGELLRRTDGRKIPQFFREEIAAKIDLDFNIGLTSKSDAARVAGALPPQPPDPSKLPPDPTGLRLRIRTSVGPPRPPLDSWEFLSSEDPSGSGLCNGRSIARLLAIVANGGAFDGMRFLSPELSAEMCTEQVAGDDPLVGHVRFGLGFALDDAYFPAPSPTAVHWGGFGGSWGVADPGAGLSFGYAPNHLTAPMGGDPRHKAIGDALAQIIRAL